MKEVISKLLREVDPDIRECMLIWDEKDQNYNWEFFTDPGNFILNWQAMRDREKL